MKCKSFPDRKWFLPMYSLMKLTIPAVIFLAVVAGAVGAHAQTVPDAYARGLSINAGGMLSGFQPDYNGTGVPASAPPSNYAAGFGPYVDVKITPWVQFEAEARWMRLNEFHKSVYEDNYLIGPRLPIYRAHFWKATPYAKFLVGYGKLNFEDNNGWGRYTDLAFGGGLDVKWSRRLTIRAADFEYQMWPSWSEGTKQTYTLKPYGLSIGVAYRVFGLK